MKSGKAYRIFMLLFCGGYLVLTLLLLIFTILTRWSINDTILDIYSVLALLYGLYHEETGRYVLCCTRLIPAVVSLIYFMCIRALREAWKKGELLPTLIPAGIGLLGLVLPTFLPISVILTPIIYFWIICLQIAGLWAKAEPQSLEDKTFMR